MIGDAATVTLTCVEQLEVGDRRCPVVVLDSPKARALADLGAVFQDLKFVMDCCERVVSEQAKTEPDLTILRGMWSAALIAYARCFNGGKRSALKVSDLGKLGLEGEVREFHEHLLAMRSKHIAHSVNPFEAVSAGVVLSPREAPSRQVEGTATMTMALMAADESGCRQLWRLCERLIACVLAPRASVLEAALLEEARTMDIAELDKLPEMGSQAPGPAAAQLSRR